MKYEIIKTLTSPSNVVPHTETVAGHAYWTVYQNDSFCQFENSEYYSLISHVLTRWRPRTKRKSCAEMRAKTSEDIRWSRWQQWMRSMLYFNSSEALVNAKKTANAFFFEIHWKYIEIQLNHKMQCSSMLNSTNLPFSVYRAFFMHHLARSFQTSRFKIQIEQKCAVNRKMPN